MVAMGPATYNLLTAQVRLRVLDFVTNAWNGLGSWRDEDIARFVNAVVPMVAGGQRQIGSLTNSYLATQTASLFGGSSAPVGLSADEISGATLRNGVEPTEVYRRPAIEMYTALSKGESFQSALVKGANRIAQLVDTDMQLAKTHAARNTLRSSKAQFYRRTLSGSENCALCVVATTQRYRTNELMPIHTHCDCGIEPIKAGSPHVLDRAQLDQVHAAIEKATGVPADRSGRGTVNYRDLMVVREHGEYGPVMTVKGQEFSGPADIH